MEQSPFALHPKESTESDDMKGMYAIFEGSDGVGKTTTMHAVAEYIKTKYPDFDMRLTHHPGSTPLGKHIRQLVKYPHQIDEAIKIDDLSRQMLYMVDTVSFIKTLLLPSLEQGTSVLADRSSFISALVYGLADGLSVYDVSRLFDLITPPKADRVYVLTCPWEVGKKRLDSDRQDPDHYDSKEANFRQKIEDTYNTLLTGPSELTLLVLKSVSADNVMYVDATMDQNEVVKIIAEDFIKVAQQKNLIT